MGRRCACDDGQTEDAALNPWNRGPWPREARVYLRVNLCACAAIVLIAGALAAARVSDEDSSGSGLRLVGVRIPTLCFIKLTTGEPCPGCGATRSLVLWFDGASAAASGQHPSGPWIGRWLIGQTVLRLCLILCGAYAWRIWPADAAFSFATFVAAMYLPILVC